MNITWTSLFQQVEFQFNVYAVPPFLTSVLIAALASFVLAKDPASRSNRSFFRFGLCIFLWLIGYAAMFSSARTETAFLGLLLAYLGVALVPATAYDVALQVTTGKMDPPYPRIQRGYFYLLSSLFYLSLLFFPSYFFRGWKNFFWGRSPLYGPIGFLFSIYCLIGMFLSLLVCRKNLQRTYIPSDQMRIRYFSVAIFIGFLSSIDFLAKFGLEIYPIGYIPILIFSCILSYAIIRLHLMDIKTAIHRTLLWAALSSLLTVPFVGLMILAKPWLEKLPYWMMLVLGMGLMAVTTYYFRTLQPVIDHLFKKGSYDSRELLDRLPQRLNEVKEVGALARRMAEILTDNLYINSIAFLTLDERNKSAAVVYTSDPQFDIEIDVDDPFISWVCRHHGIVQVKLFQNALPGRGRATQAYLARRGIVLCLALGTGPLFGLLLLGPKVDRKTFDEVDLNLLNTLRMEGSSALEALHKDVPDQSLIR